MSGVRRLIALFVVAIMMFSHCFTVFAGEAADYAANIIINEYYPALSSQETEEIRKITLSNGNDNEKITAMCALLDKYSEYDLNPRSSTTSKADAKIEYTVGSFLYIKIDQFVFGVDEEVADLITQYKDKALILDLSDCTGGVLAVMDSIAKMLVPSGAVYTAQYRETTETSICESSTGGQKSIVLTSNKTASCAEILAASLQESGAAIVIGSQTYGKASIQKQCVLPNGGMLKLTVGRWLTRDGKDINGIGLTPDVSLCCFGITRFKQIFLGVTN